MNKAGRPKIINKKVMISVKLPTDIIWFLRSSEESQAVIIENALRKAHRELNLKEKDNC